MMVKRICSAAGERSSEYLEKQHLYQIGLVGSAALSPASAANSASPSLPAN